MEEVYRPPQEHRLTLMLWCGTSSTVATNLKYNYDSAVVVLLRYAETSKSGGVFGKWRRRVSFAGGATHATDVALTWLASYTRPSTGEQAGFLALTSTGVDWMRTATRRRTFTLDAKSLHRLHFFFSLFAQRQPVLYHRPSNAVEMKPRHGETVPFSSYISYNTRLVSFRVALSFPCELATTKIRYS